MPSWARPLVGDANKVGGESVVGLSLLLVEGQMYSPRVWGLDISRRELRTEVLTVVEFVGPVRCTPFRQESDGPKVVKRHTFPPFLLLIKKWLPPPETPHKL